MCWDQADIKLYTAGQHARLFSSSDNWLNVLELVPDLLLCFYNESPDSLSPREIFVRMNDEGRGMFMGERRKG